MEWQVNGYSIIGYYIIGYFIIGYFIIGYFIMAGTIFFMLISYYLTAFLSHYLYCIFISFSILYFYLLLCLYAAAAAGMRSIGVTWGSHPINSVTPAFSYTAHSMDELRGYIEMILNEPV
jgi:hypothetical protein